MREAMVALIGLLYLVSCNGAQGAAIDRINSEVCKARLSGEINEGDFERLKTALPEVRGGTLCLDSPGGSYEEALRVAEFVHENGIATLIDQGQHCYSACALIFMAGTAFHENSIVIDRRLHILGTLGFHAPYLAKDKKRYDQVSLDVAYRTGMVALGKLLDIARNSAVADRNNVFPVALLAEALKRGPLEAFEVDTVRKAIEYKIDLDGVPELTKLTQEKVCTACSNLHPLFPFTGCLSEDDVKVERKGDHEEFSVGVPGVEEGAALLCIVTNHEYKFTAFQKSRKDGDIKPWYVYPANMPIEMLSLPVAGQSLAEQLPQLPDHMRKLESHRLEIESLRPRYYAPGATLERCELHCIVDDKCSAYQFESEPNSGTTCRTYAGSPIVWKDDGSIVGLKSSSKWVAP